MSRENPTPTSSSVNRRAFFRQVLLGGLEKVEQAGQTIGQGIASLGALDEPPPAELLGLGPGRVRHLRPPSALAESAFEATCGGCAECVQACPANCIVLDHTEPTESAEPVAGGLPYIVARASPCVVCNDLSCMKVCPTGALTLVDRVEQINMGRAVTDHGRCLRGASGGDPDAGNEDCRLCITRCPLGEAAIGLDGRGLVEVRDGCIGCGVCEHACPTEPQSIWIVPAPQITKSKSRTSYQ